MLRMDRDSTGVGSAAGVLNNRIVGHFIHTSMDIALAGQLELRSSQQRTYRRVRAPTILWQTFHSNIFTQPYLCLGKWGLEVGPYR